MDDRHVGLRSFGAIYDRLSAHTEAALRVVTGGIMIPHGFEHLFGRRSLPEWFTGVEPELAPRFWSGVEPFAGFLASEGYEPAYFWAVTITFVQLLGGLFLALGLFTRVAAASIGIFLFVSIFQVAGLFGYWGNAGGWEFPLLWFAAALVFVARGGGRFSIDRWIEETDS